MPVAEEAVANKPMDIQKDFPILQRTVNGQRLVYLDNASTSQKPQTVIDALVNYYTQHNGNIHRGIHTLSEESTALYENARQATAQFIGAQSTEIIFTRNTTESINLVAYAWARQHLKAGDRILVTALEHHSNLVPWQEVCAVTGAELDVVNYQEDYCIHIEDVEAALTPRTKLVAVTQMSNVLGTIIPIKEMVSAAHGVGAKVLVDAAQSVPHMPVNVQDLECEWLAFSAHKMLGPTGVGVLFASTAAQAEMVPFLTGGGMIKEVDQLHTGFLEGAERFEAGTPNVADVVAFKSALDYLNNFGMQKVLAHGQKLYAYAHSLMTGLPNITVYGPQPGPQAGPVISFNIQGVHPHDVASIFNEHGVAIRAGHHCAQPLMNRLGVPATARMSFYIYNTEKDVDEAVKAIQAVQKIFSA